MAQATLLLHKCAFSVTNSAAAAAATVNPPRPSISAAAGPKSVLVKHHHQCHPLQRGVSKNIKEQVSRVHASAGPLNLDVAEVKVSELAWWDAFYRFTRPHTIIGTAIGIVSISFLAVESPADLSLKFAAGLCQALVPALLMNIYIVGLNQITDIDIDKVNKPYLPLASGEFSLGTCLGLVISSALLSLGIGAFVNSKPLLWALTVSLLLGTAYSVELPFLRWKRSAVAAASCILLVRALVVQLAFFLHMQAFVLRRPPVLPKSLLFATAFMCFFSLVIALFKDIPDVEGDKTFGIQSFSVRLGQNKVFWLCIALLQTAYAAAIVIGATSSVMWSKLAMTLGHGAFATILWLKSKTVDLSSKASVSSFYMFIWKVCCSTILVTRLTVLGGSSSMPSTSSSL